jgi:hypothetical protein
MQINSAKRLHIIGVTLHVTCYSVFFQTSFEKLLCIYTIEIIELFGVHFGILVWGNQVITGLD